MHSEAGLTFLRLLSVLLAVGFSLLVVAFIRRCFGGWASDSALGKGAALSLLSIVIALVLGSIINIWSILAHGSGAQVWFQAFISAALCEETGRYIVLLILFRGMITEDPREFIAGAAAIGLGFGVIENLLYISGSSQFLALGALRGVMSAPAHLSFSCLSAYGLWCGLRRGDGPLIMGLFYALAVLLHGFFDYTLMSWPTDAETLSAFATLKALVNGLGICLVTSLTAIATLLILTEFYDFAQSHAPHDGTARRSLSYQWQRIGRSTRMLALLVGAAPLAFMLKSLSTGVALLPLLIGTAISLALWAMAFEQMAQA